MTDDKAKKIAMMEAARKRIEAARATVHPHDDVFSEFRTGFLVDRDPAWVDTFHTVQREHGEDIDAWAKAFLDFHPVSHQRTVEAVRAWADHLPWPDDRGGIEQAKMGVRMSVAMRMAYSGERHLTPLQKYRLDHSVEVDEGASMDLAKQMEAEFKPFLSPDLQLDGTDQELADLRKKLLAVDQAIGRHHEVKFQLRRRGYEIAIEHPRSMSTVDEIRRDAIVAEIEMIMRGEQS
ncbi:hypothetical protein [Rhizobium giardinii]|uniref:hypothetical protein n=1 Tax=Rhizobium giardinii TaxID=56731 RepID=UPI003D6E518F